ncbi:MAG: DNA cytosine methyltransferase, partial [Allomuricauda sp.]
GRDFAIMLKSLNDLGYAVEWRVINAAEYGMPQRRRRVFFLGYHKSSPLFESLRKAPAKDWILEQGTLASAFAVKASSQHVQHFSIDQSLVELSEEFNAEKGLSPFLNSGVCVDGRVSTLQTEPHPQKTGQVLADILENGSADESLFISEEELPKWEYLKGAKKEIRRTKAGFEYNYSEGSMVFPDTLDQPSRTIITGEGGKSPSRFKHVVQTPKGLRRLSPVELERLNMFPDNHTQLEGISDAKRAFFMGNALVVGVVKEIGATLFRKVQQLEE